MALTVVTTPFSPSANSYADLDDLAAYLSTRPDVWSDTASMENYEADQRARALVTATRLMDEEFAWDGWAMESAQVLLWPRGGLSLPNGWPLDPATIPDRLRDATCELAIALLQGNRTLDSDAEIFGLKSLKAGPVALEFKSGIGIKPVTDRVLQMVGLWVIGGGMEGTIPLVRV